jgi:hypothetical protein
MIKEQLELLDTLLRSNKMMFDLMATGEYGKITEQSNRNARDMYTENQDRINDILGIREMHKTKAVNSWIEQCQEIINNKEDVCKFMHTIKNDVDDLEWGKTTRTYKVNKEGKFDVIDEKLETPVRRIFSQLEDMNYTRAEWEDTVKDFAPEHGHKDNFFDDDIIAAAKAFMVGPVSVQNQKAIAAESRTFNSLEALKESILAEAKVKDMVLFLTFTYEKLEFDETTFKFIEDGPKQIKYVWRGVFLDKEPKGGVALTKNEMDVFSKFCK